MEEVRIGMNLSGKDNYLNPLFFRQINGPVA